MTEAPWGHHAIDRRARRGIAGDEHLRECRGSQMDLQFGAQAINKAADGA
jgi:hypothetical protein